MTHFSSCPVDSTLAKGKTWYSGEKKCREKPLQASGPLPADSMAAFPLLCGAQGALGSIRVTCLANISAKSCVWRTLNTHIILSWREQNPIFNPQCPCSISIPPGQTTAHFNLIVQNIGYKPCLYERPQRALETPVCVCCGSRGWQA